MVAAIVTGCVRAGPLAPDEKTAARQLKELLPKGTSEARAVKVLVAHGFNLSRLSSDAPANHLVVGSHVSGSTFWQVGVVIIDAKVASTTVTITNLASASK